MLCFSAGPNRHTFQCPYCGLKNLECGSLREHCMDKHARDARPVVSDIFAFVFGVKKIIFCLLLTVIIYHIADLCCCAEVFFVYVWFNCWLFAIVMSNMTVAN